MMNRTVRKLDMVKPVFVETIPADSEELKTGILYICMKYNTLVHRCPCGCGGLSEIGLHPATRRLIYDGQYVSIVPSIGVRTLRCRSHYWITKNRIVWERPLSEELDDWFDQGRRDQTRAHAENLVVDQKFDRKRQFSRLMHNIKKWLR